MNLLIISHSIFLVESLESSAKSILHLPFCFGSLYFIFWLISLARISGTMLNRSGESRHPCLVLDHKKIFFGVSPLNIMLAVCLPYIWLLQFWVIFLLYTQFVKNFYHEPILNFVKWFFCIYWDDHVIFTFFFFRWHINWFAYVETFLYPSDEFHLIMVYDPFTF